MDPQDLCTMHQASHVANSTFHARFVKNGPSRITGGIVVMAGPKPLVCSSVLPPDGRAVMLFSLQKRRREGYVGQACRYTVKIMRG
jgi:hypothetical protein